MISKWIKVLHVPNNTSSIEVDNNYLPRYVEASYSNGTTEFSPGLRRKGREADHVMMKPKFGMNGAIHPFRQVPSADRQTDSFIFSFTSFTDWKRLSTITKKTYNSDLLPPVISAAVSIACSGSSFDMLRQTIDLLR